MTRALFVLAACAVGCAETAAHADSVERRGNQPPVRGRVTLIDDAGVLVTAEAGATTTIAWDCVREVRMDAPDAKLAEYLPRATELWRARSRVERGDYGLAEPIFARAFVKYRGQKNETALVIAEGFLRCCIAQQAHEQAVIPALETARLRRAGITTAAYSKMLTLLDERTMLCPFIPPFWVRTPGLARAEADLAAYVPGDDVIAAMAWHYRRALRAELGMPPLSEAGPVSGDAGSSLLRGLADALAGDQAQRPLARDRLLKGLGAMNGWAEAWTRFALGSSLLTESDGKTRQSGHVQLAHVPALFATDQPYLSGLALARMAAALDEAGQHEAATALRAELQKSYATHPILAALPRIPAASNPVSDS